MDLSLQFRGISRPQLSHSSFGLDLQLALALGVVLLSIDWILSEEGQAAIASYKAGGRQLFFPNAGS